MDIAPFLHVADPSSPSGLDLRNDARFHAIDHSLQAANRAARLQMLSKGGTGAVELDWSALEDEVTALAQTGRDLRLLVVLTRLWTNQHGLAGVASGLNLIAQTLEAHWPTLHPNLRPSPSPREAALRRINALHQLENPDGGVLGDLEFVTLLSPRGLGPMTGGDLAAAALNRSAFLVEAPKGLGEKELADLAVAHEARLNRVTAGCRATAAERPEEMAALRQSLADAQAALAAVEAALAPHVTENDMAVRFEALSKFLARIGQALDATAAPQAAASPAASPAEEPLAMSLAPSAAAPAPAPAGLPGQVNSRRDVERMLDLIIDFYERTEPSSPLPHLARRMRKMVAMNFMQLMEEIAPSGLKEFRSVAGVFEDKNKSGRE
ncbi:type VI secretion system ImpA family N-terminal domain-containing protein [Xinfangfangia sp. CPCC 101601]|uniref:Type VI secretion system ImpA family N-terminal domain-containing protein n=1 Tax=Pseudogemmobacter lacusdianii TaxID=3069608 RepID=A0ABU0VVI0_9RHOB|nr:type VI secretion system ImpA family N-terminal domain-containing protein [Xinfangfangia sp. CPCC 101601]MDQ2065688.1 type VI secretion system ImpA family N-terminal domain-containing protein [Xinfangfangia sp. CPCC 101601]